MASELTHGVLLSLLSYDPVTGLFTWSVKRRGTVNAGDAAGKPMRNSYLRIQVCRKAYLAHRLAWFYVTGNWPKGEIDHRNGVRSDNRVLNLRDVTRTTNRQNLRGPTARNKSSGLLGVAWHNRPRPWRAAIVVDGHKKHIGYFETPEAASAAYIEAKRRLHAGNTL